MIQIRVDSELKRKFYELAERNGDSPSNLLRSLMRQALERDDVRIQDLEQRHKEYDEILYEILSVLQKQSFLAINEKQWEVYRESTAPECLQELIGDRLRNSGIEGEKYSRLHREEIEENWFIDFDGQSPILNDYLRRDTMDRTHRKLLSEKNGKPRSNY